MVLAETTRFRRTREAVLRGREGWSRAGDQALFYWDSVIAIPRALQHYKKETLRLIAEISMGTGALAMIGGTVVVVGFLTLFTGGTIAVQGYSSLSNIGVEALTGFFSAFINVRIAVPVIAGIALAATIGAGATAQLGAMRVSEEIDALEVMAIHSIPYLVSTRIVAGSPICRPTLSSTSTTSTPTIRSVRSTSRPSSRPCSSARRFPEAARVMGVPAGAGPPRDFSSATTPERTAA